MVNSEIGELRKGDVVVDEQGRTYTVAGDATDAKSATHKEAWAVSASGAFVVRVTANGGYRRKPVDS